VHPGADHETLPGPGNRVPGTRPQPHEVADRAAQEQVVPPGDVQPGDLDVPDLFIDPPRCPVAIVRGMVHPVADPGDQRSRLSRIQAVREVPEQRLPVPLHRLQPRRAHGITEPLRLRAGDGRTPRRDEPQPQGTILVAPSFVRL
jgi:hypothetical protein